MFLIGFPLLLVPFAIYNIIAFLMPGVSWSSTLTTVHLASGADWTMSAGDMLIVLAVLLLFGEVMKSTRIGSDCYCLVSQPGKPVWGYNGSGRAGAKGSYDRLRAQGMSEIGDSIHAVTVPGALDAWEALLKTHGRFGLDRALSAAIKYAEGGFPVAPRVAWDRL